MSEQSITKQCTKCKEIKPLSEFYKNVCYADGYTSWCKVCQKQYRQSNKGKTAQKRYRKSAKGKLKRKTYFQSEKYKAIKKRYRQSKKGKLAHSKYVKKYEATHPNWKKIHNAVNDAIRSGKLPRPDTLQCHYCPAQAKEYHHHKGYAPEHWLDVVPVCIPCHRNLSSG